MGFVFQISKCVLAAADKIDSNMGTQIFKCPAHQHTVVYLVITDQHSKFVAHTTPRNLLTAKGCRNRAIFCVDFLDTCRFSHPFGMKRSATFIELCSGLGGSEHYSFGRNEAIRASSVSRFVFEAKGARVGSI